MAEDRTTGSNNGKIGDEEDDSNQPGSVDGVGDVDGWKCLNSLLEILG